MRVFRAVRRPLSVLLVFLLLGYCLSPYVYLGAFILSLDTVARYRDFCRLRMARPRDFLDVKLYAAYRRHSWCSRGICEAVFPESKYVFREWGYRSYHVLPDGFPFVFLKLRFWKSVIGV